MCLHGHAAGVLQRRQTDTVVRGVKGGWGDEFHSAATRNSFGYVLLNHYLPADFGQEAIFPVVNTNMWNESPSASMVFLPHKGGFVAFFYCEMLHIDFLHVDFLSFFLSWGTFTSFLLTHRPQSDKLLWYIPVGAGGDPHPPDTLGLVLPICRSNWNTWTINLFSSPPRLWKEKGSHPNKSVTSPECMHLFYTWWLSSCCRLQPRFLSLPTPFAWASRGCAYKMCCNLTNHSMQPVQWRSFVVVRCRIVALGVTFTTFGENLPYSYSQGLWGSSDLTLGAL